MSETSGPPGAPARVRAFGTETRTVREVAFIGGALALGLLVLPILIWLVGSHTLGPYSHGDDPRGLGPLALYGDYYSGLARGWLGYWAVAVGPLVLLALARLWLALLRRLPHD